MGGWEGVPGEIPARGGRGRDPGRSARASRRPRAADGGSSRTPRPRRPTSFLTRPRGRRISGGDSSGRTIDGRSADAGRAGAGRRSGALPRVRLRGSVHDRDRPPTGNGLARRVLRRRIRSRSPALPEAELRLRRSRRRREAPRGRQPPSDTIRGGRAGPARLVTRGRAYFPDVVEVAARAEARAAANSSPLFHRGMPSTWATLYPT